MLDRINPELALRIVRESRVIAYDTETSGLSPGIDFICGYVITDWDNSLYIPVRHEAGGNIPNPEEFEAALNDAFAERGRMGYLTIGHNLGFDLRFSGWHGVFPRAPLEDTMLNENLIDDRTMGYGLDDCCTRHQVTAKKGSDLYAAIARRFGGIPDRKQMANFWRMPGDDEYVIDYATGDGVSTLELWQSQQRLLDAEELRQPWQLECDLLPYIARMHLRGMKVDHNYADQLLGNESTKGSLTKAIEQAKSKFTPGFNVRSSSDIENLYRANGFTDTDFAYTSPTPRNPKGQVSFREQWLERNEIGKAILEVRRLEKAQSSFIMPLVDTKNIKGRVHPILNQSKSDDGGTIGSRLSCSDPNLQAYPKRNKEIGKLVRPLIIADDGMLLEEGDAMQQEPRLFTHYSEDPYLIEGYRSGKIDIHDRANELLFEGKDRNTAKRMAMGMLTMMSPPTLAGHMNWPESKARAAHQAFFEAFPDIHRFQQTAMRVFKQRGYVKSILGRKARLESPKWAYRAISRIIQNSGGEHIKTCILRANQYEDVFPDKLQVLMSIHDSLLWQRDPGHDLKEFVAILENVPHEPQFNLLVPIPFEIGSGPNWGIASYEGEIKGKHGWLI